MSEALFSRRNIKSNPYGLTEEDIIGDIKGFPIGVIVRMLEEQSIQCKRTDIIAFQRSRKAGFSWAHTEAGWVFWDHVLNENNFDLFFKEYPDYEMYNIS